MHPVSESSKYISDKLTSYSPAVCRAGYFQFSSAQRFRNECIQSRGLYWCKSGRGYFEIGGKRFELVPHDLYILPWNRDITHYPDANEPMHTGHVHIVPDYNTDAKWIPNIPHESSDAEFNSPHRRDAHWPGFEETFRMKIKANEPLGLLLDYTIRWFVTTSGEIEAEARSLAYLILNELFRKQSQGIGLSSNYPKELERMVIHVQKGFQLGPTVTDLADLIGRSRSHVLKLFSKHLGISPKSFIIDCQLTEARELLLSTTLPIAEVGQSVGISDPYHFSKIFRRHIGISPSEFRNKHGPVSVKYKASKTHQKFPDKPIK